MKWSVGDKVMAKWPGSALYFHAEIKSIDEVNETAEILYSDGTDMEIPIKFIKAESVFAQQKRSKSPSRSRRRSKSPGRSPARKSRVLKKDDSTVDKKERRSRSTSRGRKSVQKLNDEKKVVITSTEETIMTETTATSEKLMINKTTLTKTKMDDTKSADARYMITRQQAKVVLTDSLRSNEPQKHDKTTDPIEHEYGGVLGTFIMYLTVPLFPLWLLKACNEKDCSFTKFDLTMMPCKWDAYFSVKSFGIVSGFLLFQAIVYALPFGYIIKGPLTPNGKRLDYKISAKYSLFFTALAYAAFYYYKIPIKIHGDMFQIAFAATLISYLATFLLYVWSFFVDKSEVNPAADTGSLIYDSFVGRYMNPRIGKLFDLKLYLYRPAMAGWVVVIWLEMARDYDLHQKHSPQLLVVAISQLLYNFLVFFYDEDQCPFMFDIKNEGLGFVQFIGELVIVPFVYSLPVRYVVDHPTNMSIPMLVLICSLLCTGFFLVGWSGRTKSLFRKNPYDHRLMNLESLPASKVDGDRILVSGLWGFVRHPNYLGEIFIGLAWSLVCGFKHLVPWYYPVFITILLLHRSIRDDVRCRKKHGHAWKMYCDRVKYRVIPGVF